MNSLIETLNRWGGDFSGFTWPMLWQSSLLITALLAFDFLFRRKIRASIRYALWLVVLVKLCLPPALALPTGAAWWLFPSNATVKTPVATKYVVTYDTTAPNDAVQPVVPTLAPRPPKLVAAGWILLGCGFVSAALLLWLAFRWWQISRRVSCATASAELDGLLNEIRGRAGLRSPLRLKLVDGQMSPAVCGLFRPMILLPRVLAEQLSAAQLRAVLLHEAFHLRRKDVWVNCAQALLQIAYWWHPLLWLANARIRRLREEAVDDAVMLALSGEAESYAPTLLAVAKLAFSRPLMSLGLVGIMESRSALRKRIERLVNFHAPRKAGLTFLSLGGILVFSAVALPMGQAPASAPEAPPADETPAETTLTVKVDPDTFIRNVKASTDWTVPNGTKDYGEILLDILRSEGVPCNPPHGIAFNTKTGEITTQNTPEKLEVFRRVIEQLNRADGKPELPLRDSPIHRQSILIEARFFWMPSGDFERLTQGLQVYEGNHGDSPWWSVGPERFGEFDDRIKSLNLKPFIRPRVQTGNGMTAEMYCGTQTNGVELQANGVEFDCRPMVIDGAIDLAFRTEITGEPTGKDQTLVGTNRYQIHGTASAEDYGGIVLHADNPDGSPDNLVMVLGLHIVTNGVASHFEQRLVPLAQPVSGNGAAAAPTKFVERISTIIGGAHPATGAATTLTFKLDRPLGEDYLKQLLLDAGVKIPPTVFFYQNNGILLVRGSKEQLTMVHRAVLKLNGYPTNEIADNDEQLVARTGSTGLEDALATNLFARTFKVDAYTFTAALRNISGLQTNSVSAIARSLFSKLGVDLESPKGKSVFYNDQLGLLFVKATESDLDTIERTIQALNYTAPQIHIKARFVEVPKQGFVWPTTDTNTAKGILNAQQTPAILKMLETKPGFKILAEPEAVTTSGRQVRMMATTLVSVVTNFAFSETASNVAVFPQSEQVGIGPFLDTVTTVLPDGYTIDLRTTASVTNFMGYDQPTNSVPAVTRAGEKFSLPTVLPRLRVQQASTHLRLWDNQTAVLSNLPANFLVNGKQADGRPEEQDKAVVVFITVTIVDAAGNRVHTDDEMPFAKAGPPPQAY